MTDKELINHLQKKNAEYIETIQALKIENVQVVRCCKCKYWHKDIDRPILGVCHNGRVLKGRTECDDYCSYGKRKENNNKQAGWISINDRLPELDNDNDVVHVLIYLDDGFITGADYEKAGFELWAESGEVTHWMPLPEPPKEC